MSFIIVLTLLVSISAFGARVEAKPLSQNYLKFRRLPPKEFSAAIGSFITLECEADGSPPPAIHWLKDGRRIQQSDFSSQLEESLSEQLGGNPNGIGISKTGSRLFIDCASYEDEAVYTCVAQTPFSRISTHTKFSLIRPPAESARTGNDENDLLSGPLSEAAEVELASANAMKQLDGGDAEPAAAAEDSKGKLIAAIPVCLTTKNTRSIVPIRIHMWHYHIVEMQTNDVILYCRSNAKLQQAASLSSQSNNQKQQQEQSTSNTDLNSYNSNGKQVQLAEAARASVANDAGSAERAFVSWTLNNEKIEAEEKGHYEILETGDLYIRNLNWTDVGQYVCTVSDELSSDSITTRLYPASKSKTNKRASLSNRLGDFR